MRVTSRNEQLCNAIRPVRSTWAQGRRLSCTVGKTATPLIGRGHEMQRLHQLLDQAAHGHGAAIVVIGGPGMGKSRLAHAAAARASQVGLQVRSARCEQLEVEASFAAPMRAFRRAAGGLHRASATRTLFEAGARAAAGSFLGDQLLEILEADCARTPVLLVMEDLHWSDTATLSWLSMVLDRVEDLPLLVLLTTRPPTPGTDPHRALAAMPGQRIALSPLSAAQTHALARAITPREPTVGVLSAVDQAGGNPLLVRSIVEAMQAGAASTADGIAAQVRELGRTALRAVQIAAVLGSDIDPVMVAAVAGHATADLLDDFDDAVTCGVLNPAGTGFTFRHELYREAVLVDLTPAGRAALHLACAHTLAAVGAPSLAVAEQYARGAGPGDRDAVTWLHYAADEIVATAPEAALRLCDIAIAVGGPSSPSALMVTKMRALAGAGRAAEARTLGEQLLQDTLPAAVEARLHRELAFAAFMQGRADIAATEMERCAALTDDLALRARVQGEVAFAQFLVLDHPGARASSERAIFDGRRMNDKTAQVAGGAVLAFLDLFDMRLDRAARHAHEIVALAEDPSAAESHVFQPWFIAAVVWLESDRLDLLPGTSRQGRERAIRHGSAWAVPAYDAISAFSSLRLGDLDDAAAAAQAALNYANDVDGFGIAVWCNAFLAQIALHYGAEQAAEQHIGEGFRWLGRGRAQFGFEQLCMASAELHQRRGDTATACSLLGEVWDLFVANGIRSALPAFGAQLAKYASSLDQAHRTVEVATVLAAVAETAGTARTRVTADLAAAWRDTDPDRATRAAELAARTPLRPLAAAAFADAAAIAARRGRTSDADRMAAEAAQRWAAIGADADATISAAVSATARPPARRPRYGVDALTGTERKVVRLLAEGKTNAEIADQLGVSRRTVESHVSASYRKLDVTSRVAMARLAMDQRIGA